LWTQCIYRKYREKKSKISDTFDIFDIFKNITIFSNPDDRRTDRRTERILIVKPRLHSMQRGKNRKVTTWIIQIVIHLCAKFEVSSFTVREILGGPNIPKVGQVTPTNFAFFR